MQTDFANNAILFRDVLGYGTYHSECNGTSFVEIARGMKKLGNKITVPNEHREI